MKFVSFHTHTGYSYADGFGEVEEHVKRVADLGMSALAVSEHGNVNSHAALERECRRNEIKPIFGLEAYFGPVGKSRTRAKTHLGLYAQNEKGYYNLNRIVTQSYIDFYQWPTVSAETLRKYSEGIVVLSGCSDSLLSCTLLGGKFLGAKIEPGDDGKISVPTAHLQRASRRLQWFLDVFGPERFFLEVQRFPQLERTCALNVAYARLAKESGVSLIATADVHYPRPADNQMQKILHASRRSGSVALNEQEWEYDVYLTYPQSDKEIICDLVDTGLDWETAEAAVWQTSRLAENCNVSLPKAKPLRFHEVNLKNVIMCGDGSNVGDREQVANFAAALTLKEKIREGWKKRCERRPELKNHRQKYLDRIQKEFSIINDKDFCDYFLVVADLVGWAKDRDITVGPGRGSAAGSLVCYLLGITEIDPLHPVFSRMIFERFIDPNRSDYPDIDLDFDDERRIEVPTQAKRLYGNENVCNVANHNRYRGKSALSGVAAAYGLSRKTFDEIGKRCAIRVETDDRVDDSIRDTLESYQSHPQVAALVDTYGDKLAQAIRLEGNQHSMGMHAGGFVISSQPIPETCAIYLKNVGTEKNPRYIQVIPYEKRDAEHLGLLKIDILGLTTMGVIGLIRKWLNWGINDLYAMFYDDYNNDRVLHSQIMSKFITDDVCGIFQYEGATTREVTRQVKPTTFDELAACNALSRPGPYYGGQTSEYIKVKNGEKDWERIHPTGFDCHVAWTYGQIVYQEQIMWILRDLAGFSTERVLQVRKIIGKKLGEFQFAQLWDEFRTGCAHHGVSEEAAAKVWSGITTAAGYAFNTSHAYSYALVAWWLMYFKIYAPVEFYAAQLAKNGDGKDDLARRNWLLQDAFNHELEMIIDPDKMRVNWEPYNNHAFMPGFMQVPNVGPTTAKAIVDWKDDVDDQRRTRRGGLRGWGDFIHVRGVGPDTIVKMVEWAASPDPFNVYKTSDQLEAFRKQCRDGEFDEFGLPTADEFYTSSDLPDVDSHVAFVGLVANVVERDELESIRTRTGKTLDQARAMLAEKGNPFSTKKATIFAYDEYGEVALRISRWRYDSLSERLSKLKPDHHVIVGYGRTFDGKANSIQLENFWILDPD